VFTCHMLEHVNYDDGAAFLRECHRAMKPGGTIRVLVPDASVLLSAYTTATLVRIDELSPQSTGRATQASKLWELLMGGGHLAIYDFTTLRQALEAAGFRDVARAPFRKSRSPVMQRETTDLYPSLSLIVEAIR